MVHTRATTRRSVLAGAAGLLAAPAIVGRAAAATRGVSDTEIIIGMMTDLSGVTAVQGTNAANSIRMAFDDTNAKGGINGRKIHFIVEDMEYLVPKAVQAMNKLVNLDNIFLSISSGGTPQMDAVLPMMIEKQVPSVFPLTCARSMYQPLSPYKYGQFASYYDQMRSCVKYFAETKGRKVIGSMYEDTDFGKDIHAGVVAQVDAMKLKLGAVSTFSPTATDFNVHVTRLKEAGCDLVCMGTIVRDTIIILQTARKMGWDVEFCGQFASYSTAVAEAPGEPAEGFYSMSPGIYAYSEPRGSRGHGPLQAALRHRHQLSGRGRLCGGGLPDRRSAAGGPRAESGHVPEVDGRHQGLARHVRWPAADDHTHGPPRLHAVVPVSGEEDAVDPGGGGAAGVLNRGVAAQGAFINGRLIAR
jgi:branched-chain amino acid transport system substrate-binding protein